MVSGRCRQLKGVVLGVDASTGPVLCDAVFVVDVMTVTWKEERVLGPFRVIGEFLLHLFFEEILILCRVNADCSGYTLDTSFGDAIIGWKGSFGEGFVLIVFVVIVAVFNVVSEIHFLVAILGVEKRFFGLRHDFLTLFDWINTRAADGIKVLLVGHFRD